MSTGISYLAEVYNPITGCSGKGCKVRDNCWARILHDKRYNAYKAGKKIPPCYSRPFSEVRFSPGRLDKPLHWRKPRRVGVAFMGDLFDEHVRFEWVHQIWDIMKRCPQHQFFTLTKQPQRMAEVVNRIYQLETMGHADGFWDHVWNGVSICDQEDADRMIPELLHVPGKKWISVEPMLSEIRLTKVCGLDFRRLPGQFDLAPFGGIDWVVLGCESGPKRRPCPQEWMVDVVRQCQAAGIPVYVKQIDIGKRVSKNPEEWPEELRIQEGGKS